MIIPMHRYSFLVHYSEYTGFLDELKSLGVVHIIEHDLEPSSEMLESYRLIKDINKATDYINKKKPSEVKATERFSGELLLVKLNETLAAFDTSKQTLVALRKEEKQARPWGGFSHQTINEIEASGIRIQFFTASQKRFREEWKATYNLSIISEQDGYVYFIVLSTNDEIIEMQDADEIKVPENSMAIIRQNILETEDEIVSFENTLRELSSYGIDVLKEYKNQLENQLSNWHATLHTADQAEGHVKHIDGWAPKTLEPSLIEFLEKQNTLYIKSDEVQEGDKPPILLKNNRFNKLFEPIGELFNLPSYIELDLTPFFAPFFMMFFGFCLGDAGYGLLFIAGAIYARTKVKEKFKPLVSLIIWLGLATVLFGAITGTFFGAKLADFEVFSEFKNYFLNDQQMFNLALIFGVIQIMLGMFVRVVNIAKASSIGYALSTMGWILVLLSFIVFASIDAYTGQKVWMLSSLHLVILGVAALGIFIFNDPKRNILMNIGAGLWDTYNMITGVTGDVLSYIRLFALGLSSAILGMVFNQLAFNLSPDIIIVKQIVTALILVLGHGLNIFMAALGSFVHPMRLTFVEFYKNAGFAGGGKAYTPFKKII